MSWIAKNEYLTQTEMENNAKLVWDYFGSRGWSLSAVAAMLGNMQTESNINPGIWESLVEYGGGYGLVQWTPYTKYSEWAGSNWQNNGNKECARIFYELNNGLQWISTDLYPLSFAEFSKSGNTPEYLAEAFLYNYERPAVQPQPVRETQARAWYNFLDGKTPAPIGGAFPVWMTKRILVRRKRR